MSEYSSNTKRIAKNSLALYFRMFLTMAVGLYTSRVILDALGVDDYGLYNLVGGFVTMFSVVQSGLVSASQRFINYSLGKDDKEDLKHTVSTIVIIYLILTLLAFILVESIGYLMFVKRLNIPIDRLPAATWTFHLSTIILVSSLIGAPFNALIIAHEKMQVFAYISILDALLKLLIAFSIYITKSDRLIVYSALLCIESTTITLLYYFFCFKNFEEVKISWRLDWNLVKKIYSFAIWSMLGGFAYMGYTQGINVLLGMFFTPAIIAARGIAVQVQSVITSFVSNFQTAVNPQIIKSYAKGEYEYFEELLLTSSKYSYLMLYMLALPFLFEAETILDLWLVEVPPNAALFLRIILITVLFDSMTTPFERAIHATGNIRKYSLSTSLTFLSIVPVAYLILKIGAEAYSVFIVQLLITIVAVSIRMYMSQVIVNLKLSKFFRKCFIPALMVSFTACIVPFLVHYFMPSGFIRMILTCITAVVSILLCTFLFGMSVNERLMLKEFLIKKLHHK